MEKVLFSTLYESKFIIKSFMKVNPSKIVLIIDKEVKAKQQESLNFIKETFKDSSILIETIQLELFNNIEIIKTIKDLIKKHNDYEIFFDITSSLKPQTFAILTYLMIARPENLKDIFYYFYSDSINEFVKVPLFDVEKLSEKEYLVLKTLNTNNNLLQKDISEKIESTEGYTSKLIDRLILSQYIEKLEKGFRLTEKGNIYLISKDE